MYDKVNTNDDDTNDTDDTSDVDIETSVTGDIVIR